jgi:hypothetical protein
MMKRWLWVLCVLPVLDARAEGGCFVMARGPATVSVGQIQKQPPVQLEDCHGLRVIAGKVSICHLSASRERVCTAYQAGDVFSSGMAKGTPDEFFGAFRAILARITKGDAHMAIGQTRGNNKVLGMPHGRIAPPENGLDLQLRAPVGEGWEVNLTLEGRGAPFFQGRVGPDGHFALPAGVLKPGNVCLWELGGEGMRFTGRFRVAGEQDWARDRKKIDALSRDPSLDEDSRVLLLAELFDELGYGFNAEVLLRVWRLPL